MSSPHFSDLSDQEQDWLDAYLDGTIDPEAFETLQDRMMESAPLRAVMRRYLLLDDTLQEESHSFKPDSEGAVTPWLGLELGDSSGSVEEETDRGKVLRFPSIGLLAAAAAVAFLLGSLVMYFGGGGMGENSGLAGGSESEPQAEGFAVIDQLFDVVWSEGISGKREGALLGSEVFQLESGIAEIQFFSGASMIVEGPAEIELKSAWEAICREGSVRMKVPPAARGFKLQAPSTEIIDLGTEFGLVVRDGKGHVEVIDGEIAVRHRSEDEKLLQKDDALVLTADEESAVTESGQVDFPDTGRFTERSLEAIAADFQRWESHRDQLSGDERLIAYYTFDDRPGGTVTDLSLPRNTELDGAKILAEPVAGRWPGWKSALEFRRPGARVRANIPGEFSAFTFAAWVRIDSLDRRYNALFMGDGYETGEPHWQIRDDGKMMLSVMVDDSRPNPNMPEDAGFHRVYFSPPMWDISKSGEWLFLVSVFDPGNRVVAHYVNGEQISTQEIEDRFFVDQLRIGNAEIGNWGQPFREDPWFSIRNLNGRMDEIAIFDAALDETEIAALHERSRAGRR